MKPEAKKPVRKRNSALQNGTSKISKTVKVKSDPDEPNLTNPEKYESTLSRVETHIAKRQHQVVYQNEDVIEYVAKWVKPNGQPICIMCKLGVSTGPLYGPYEFVGKDSVHLNIQSATKNHEKSPKISPKVKGRRGSEPKSLKVYLHEDCALWSYNIELEGFGVVGIEDELMKTADKVGHFDFCLGIFFCFCAKECLQLSQVSNLQDLYGLQGVAHTDRISLRISLSKP